jgi:hypothetical protein
MNQEDRESEGTVFGSFTSAVGLALGELLLFAGRPEELQDCLHSIEIVARATLLSAEVEKGKQGREHLVPLVGVAYRVVEAWHEETRDLNALGEAIVDLQEVLEARGVQYTPPSILPSQ